VAYLLQLKKKPATALATNSPTNKKPTKLVGFLWWVLTGSKRRHSPCKGDAIAAGEPELVRVLGIF
jgi:hypothetical protein